MGEFNRDSPRRGRSDRRDSPRRSFGDRNSSRGRFSGRFNQRGFGPREMHKAVCAECGQECEVPFKPREGREVFCKECFRRKNPRY